MNPQTEAPQAGPRYRPNVAAIVRDAAGKILICERADVAGAWQFPQGGIDEGESPEQALTREMGEEISLGASDVRIIACKGPYRYLYPSGITKRGWQGVEQLYFLVELVSEKSRVNVATAHPEFRATRWIAPEEFQLGWLIEMKREVYAEVFRDFFKVELQPRSR